MAAQYAYVMKNMTKTFTGAPKPVLNNINLQFYQGAKIGIVGPNGAGKTTLMDIITGRTAPDAGRVIFGQATDLTRLDEAAIANLGIGRKFQKPTVFEHHSVFENLELALSGQRGVIENLFFRLSSESHFRIEKVLMQIGLHQEVSRRAGELSHGQKQCLKHQLCRFHYL